ncbi:MAG TPA: SDR family NAD(P)-dependent oxidoreductase [Ktedonobacterales bacterium]|jgi:NAD(P)-dependent dehydrogenase (short-subunit alcohol dehydrogenase family)
MRPTVYDFSGRVALVTGATGGLGPAVVRAFIEAGAVVVGISSRMDEEREGAIRSLLDNTGNDRLTLVALDATDEASVAQVVADTRSAHGHVDILINGIGGFHAGEPVTQTPLETWEHMFILNLRPTFLFSKHAARAMADQSWGRIINFSSRAARSGRKNAAAYATAKGAINTLTEAQADELRDAGVTVNAILPSIIDTPANRTAIPTADTSRWPTAEQVARVALFLASDDAGLISGASIPVYGRA